MGKYLNHDEEMAVYDGERQLATYSVWRADSNDDVVIYESDDKDDAMATAKFEYDRLAAGDKKNVKFECRWNFDKDYFGDNPGGGYFNFTVPDDVEVEIPFELEGDKYIVEIKYYTNGEKYFTLTAKDGYILDNGEKSIDVIATDIDYIEQEIELIEEE